ncbi:MAG: methylenetetrahydrofolate reductase [Candidatus Omnitrophica bacterium]|nr:methylenetetrahydrofolate reductase [Candidatus Omnitrophota bacterium]
MEKFKNKLEKGEFVITTEIGPPKGLNLKPVIDELDCVKGRVDAVNVTDQQSAVMRLGSVAASVGLIKSGFEPICQFTCRDRNRIALESDILSAGYLGIENVLVMTGDHPFLGDPPEAKPVYDLDAVGLLAAISKLQSGTDLSGKELHGAPSFYVGAVVNPFADPIEPEIIKMEKKVLCGARFFQTQAIFDRPRFEKFLKAISGFRNKIKLLRGIVPLKSAKSARYMNENIPGVFIPELIIDRLDKSRDINEDAAAIAFDVFQSIRSSVDGVHFMPIRANHLVARVLDKIKR